MAMDLIQGLKFAAEKKLQEAGLLEAPTRKKSPPPSPPLNVRRSPESEEEDATSPETFVPIRSGLKNRNQKQGGGTTYSHSEPNDASSRGLSPALASLLQGSTFKVGQTKAEAPEVLLRWEEIEEKNGGVLHKLTPADTLDGICIKFSITVDAIRKINRLFQLDQNSLRLRKTIVIPITKQVYHDTLLPHRPAAIDAHADRSELVVRFAESAGTDQEVAITYLQMRGWNLEKALQLIAEDRRRGDAASPNSYKMEYPDEAEIFEHKDAIPTPSNVRRKMSDLNVEVFSL